MVRGEGDGRGGSGMVGGQGRWWRKMGEEMEGFERQERAW